MSNPFNTIFIICDLLSTNYTLPDNTWLKDFKRLNNLSCLRKLPAFDDSKCFILNGKKVLAGTVLKRPVKHSRNINIGLSYFDSALYHYGVYLGISIDAKIVIIEMTSSPYNVRLVDEIEFLDVFYGKIEIEVATEPAIGITREIILQRASKYEYDSYNLWDLNCIDFAYYCALNIEPFKRSLEIDKVKLGTKHILINYWNLQYELSEDLHSKQIFRKRILQTEFEIDILTNKISPSKKVFFANKIP